MTVIVKMMIIAVVQAAAAVTKTISFLETERGPSITEGLFLQPTTLLSKIDGNKALIYSLNN